ncbi:hypothetical protein C0Q70_16699 [Pomacea canaliculata]|uniref:Uncharacterized protein n=1 Tax=Pomacea canaliculata TaxID=400727 RepID=A0A2T7NQH9_POMCA|nr:hypothetical protein C0Q70_16699 [Pomacea canaliculata]
MEDSLKIAANMRVQGRLPAGHVYKGHAVVAANASIPTKFQTIVTENADKKGFMAQAKRFQDFIYTETPAPGKYLTHAVFESQSPSFSKKGTGGFASKSKRSIKYIASTAPGPGLYGLPSMLTTRKDFNRGSQSVFCQPIAEHVEKTNGIPAPNMYNVLQVKVGKANNVTASAAFKSKSKREGMIIKDHAQMPAPCQYHIKDDFLHESPKVPFSSFKSQSKRKFMPDPYNHPGPAHYKPNEPVELPQKQTWPRKHYLCISAPAMPLPEVPPAPGPGAYDVVDYEGPAKHYMSSAAFVSNTSRWTDHAVSAAVDMPGPVQYLALQLPKGWDLTPG